MGRRSKRTPGAPGEGSTWGPTQPHHPQMSPKPSAVGCCTNVVAEMENRYHGGVCIER